MGRYNPMNTKGKPFSLKKTPYYIALGLLTIGASLILGFLSFSGMLALAPTFLVPAIAVFILSVAYEGEIYLQNIKGALAKLFKTNYINNTVAKEYLSKHLINNLAATDCPEFFKDYETQLHLLGSFDHQTLNAKSQKRKKHIEKTLGDMEKWFASKLFAQDQQKEDSSDYSKELVDWLKKQPEHQQKEWQNKLSDRRVKFNIAKIFSICSALFMGLGTTYLIVEAFAAIPLLAAIPFTFWPIFIIPMAFIAGTAYGLLTYNSVTDLINNDTIRTWFNKFRNDLSEGLSFRNVFMTLTTVFLVTLATVLTICTAGTWWTIAANARPLFGWMKNMPSFIMGIINPIITGTSALFFIIQNTAESLQMVDEELRSKENVFIRAGRSIKEGINHVLSTENALQIINPFRLLLKVTITPLRILLFLGHLVSIALTADRMPGVPQIVAALVAIISEGFEDAHYFMGHSHNPDDDHNTETLLKEHLQETHGHNHDADIPTKILKALASPIYLLAALWDFSFSKLNPEEQISTPDHHHDQEHSHQCNHSKPKSDKLQPTALTFKKAWNKQWDVADEQEVIVKEKPLINWQKEQAFFLIERYKSKHLNTAVIGKDLACQKAQALNMLQTQIVSKNPDYDLETTLKNAQNNEIWNTHRLFAISDAKTTTQTFIDALPERIFAR